MGVDIYLRWDGMTKDDEMAQYTGFSIGHGHVGYLREAYHGGPYATRVLFPETWESEDCEAAIPSKILRERLPAAIEAAIERARVVYGEEVGPESPEIKSLKNFVELYERLEAEGKHPYILNSY